MSPAHHTTQELDRLIDKVTVDSHDEDEQLMGVEGAFDEDAASHAPGTVVGEHVEVLHVGQGDSRRELIATCRRWTALAAA